MAQQPQKNVRKLVSLSPELAERVEEFRVSSGATSESDTLKACVADGLKLHARPIALLRRCVNPIANRQRIAEVISQVTANRPLVERTMVDNDDLTVFLRTQGDEAVERFRFSRAKRTWDWERYRGNYEDDWESIRPA